MLRTLQNKPRFLEWAYKVTYQTLRPLRGLIRPGTWVEGVFIKLEKATKGATFDCRMCGMCVLHSTGMTCPMTCPKNLRNGPCGGVRPNGNCEVFPDKPCIWVQAWERSKQMADYGQEILVVQPPVNYELQGTSSWINEFHRKEEMAPDGWRG